MYKQIPELSKIFDLKEDDLFVDVGGYIGDFTKHVFDNFQCECLVFEPFFPDAKERFKGHPKIRVIDCGLGDKTELKDVYEHREGTSVFQDWHNVQEPSGKVLLLDARLINTLDIKAIKLNCEGSEYEILKAIEPKIPQILVQFHKIKDEKYNEVVELLSKTHVQTKFEKGWELWKIK